MLPVDIFTPAESVEFLRKRTGQDDEDAAKALAEALGNLPLGLEQAGAYIQETGETLTGYLSLYRERQVSILKRGKPVDYHATVDATWDISFRQAEKESKASADLLNLCAFFAPDNIPEQLLIRGAQKLPDSLASAIEDKMEFNDAVKALRRYSLISREKGSFSVHRLVQAVTRNRLEEDDQKKWAEAAVQLVDDAFPFDSDDVRTWAECSVMLPHALATVGHAEVLEVDPEATGRLLNQIGLYLYGRAKFDEAGSAFKRALEIGKKTLGPYHPNVAININNLGRVLQNIGDLRGAKERFEQALKIDEKALGTDNPIVAIDINNLGSVLQKMGDLEGAKERYERALKIDENVYGPNNPEVARVVNNLGSVLQKMGDLEGAKERYERALKIDEKVYGPDHPEVAFDINNLGSVLKDMGDHSAAKENFERALKIFQSRLGEDHPLTLKVQNNLKSIRR